MENDNKKTLILSIVGILVLVIAVVGVSFAMYSFSGTGSKENVIQTGTISMNFSDGSNVVSVPNKYPMSDEKGVALTDNKADFGVELDLGTSTTTMTIGYDLGITGQVPGATLTEEYVKVALLDGNGNVIVGAKDESGALTAGVTIASLKDEAGANGLITNYALISGTLTNSSKIDNYTILAYVSEDYDLPIAVDTTQDANNLEHKKATASETFKFKVTVAAAQK